MSTEKTSPSIGRRLFRILAGYEIALVCLMLLFVITFFATVEQQWIGLYRAIEKYFASDSFIAIPRWGEAAKVVPLPLPGGYWVQAVLFMNLTLGGLIRVRKNWRKFGILISHFSILFMLAAGAVSDAKKIEGIMHIFEDEKSNYAEKIDEPSLEVSVFNDDGSRGEPWVITSEDVRAAEDATVTVEIAELPFSVQFTGFRHNAALGMESRGAPKEGDGPVVDGFYLVPRERDKLEERNASGAYLTLIGESGEELKKLLVWEGNPYPVTFTHEGTRYGFVMTSEIWPMPFEVELHRSVGEYYPGTRRARHFQSDVVKVDGENRESYEIVMNEPMRHGGYILYQASWLPPGPDGRAQTGLQTVNNPSDKWPEWALYAATAGLVIHFGMMLFFYAGRSRANNKQEVKA